MLMSKLYNKAKSYTHNDPRVITPSSIPIFILPPTLDKIPNHKSELEDTFDCWSLEESKQEPVTNFGLEKSDSKFSKSKKTFVQDESDFTQKATNQLKSSPLVIEKKSPFKQLEASNSLENLVKNTFKKDSSIGQSVNRKSFDASSQSNFHTRKQNSSKSLVKNLFRSGFLSNSIIQDDTNIKENFCKLWVLHGDYKPVGNSVAKSFTVDHEHDSQVLKSASVNNLNFKSDPKNEEQLQREHLINLLSQLQTEDKQSGKKNTKGKYKKEKRSKSETLLTLTSLLSSDLDNRADIVSNKSPGRKRSSNLSSRCLNVLSTPSKNNYGYFLDVGKSRDNSLNTDNITSSRRFSFRNLFSKISQKKSSTISIDSKQVNELEKTNSFNVVARNKSLSNSSSITSNSSQLVGKASPIASAAGSALKFQSFKTNEKSTSQKTQSDPMVNKINLSPAKSSIFKSSFKSAKSNYEDDYDKIFSEYMTKNGTKANNIDTNFSDKKHVPTSGKKCKNLFRYLFKTKSCTSDSSVKHRRSRTLDSSIKKKINFFNRKNSINSKIDETNNHVEKAASESDSRDELESVKSSGSDPHHLSLNNCDFFQIEKDAKKKKTSLSKSNETLYIDASLLRNKRLNDKGFLKALRTKEKMALKCLIDVSFEKLQQNMKGHMISIDIKNLRVDPLIEINYIKAKLSYLTLELVESGQETPGRSKLMAKIRKIKLKKCKFDNNLKNLCKPIDFDLVNEHFMAVTEEAMNLQIRKMHGAVDQGNEPGKKLKNGSSLESGQVDKKFVFYLNVELHSYIPVSRKILSSTFRKKKRIFKGQCQIHENFINSTQFTKVFVLNEI